MEMSGFYGGDNNVSKIQKYLKCLRERNATIQRICGNVGEVIA